LTFTNRDLEESFKTSLEKTEEEERRRTKDKEKA